MASIPNEFSISLQSWPSKTDDPRTSLPDLIKRIKSERGSFREISEESLRREIAEEDAGKNAEDDNSTSEEEEDDEEDDKPDRLKELMRARDELIGQIEQAHQSAMFSLDFVSLLLSSRNPAQAGQSVSPFLRDTVGLGTLGADKIQTSRVTDGQKKEDKRIAKGWKIQSLNNAVDSILVSATRLEKEIELETKYWEQVLAISENGWAICRLPNEKHTLGVRFGFSEAAPAFKNRSLAALRRKADGTISLDQGIASTEPQCVRVRITTNDTETGSSSLPKPIPEDAPVESEILEARNTVFSLELWQEINRESRTLAAYGVRSKGDTITYPLSATKTIILDLLPLDDMPTPASGKDDVLAESISIALHLLLSFAHRQNHRKRTRPPPPISAQKPQTPPYTLLRPLITRLKHEETLSSLQSLFPPLIAVLTSTRLTPPPSYTTTSTTFSTRSTTLLTTAEKTLLSLTDGLETITAFTVTPSTTLTITSRTAQFQPPVGTSGTIHHISLNDESPLNETCKPPPQLTSFAAVKEYVLFATGCALASSFASPLPVVSESGTGDEEEEGEGEGWKVTSQPHVLRKSCSDAGPSEGRSKQLSFLILEDSKAKGEGRGSGLRLKIVWDWMRDMAVGKEEGRERVRERGEGSYEWNEKMVGEWEEGEGEVVRSLEDVVEGAGKL